MRDPIARPLILALVLGLVATAPAVASTVGAVICSDYTASATVGRLQLSAPWTFTPNQQPVYQDAVAVWHDDLVYVVNRAGADNVQVLDPAQSFTTVAQFNLGPNRGLKHLAFAQDGTAWVSCYDTAELLHIDPTSGAILHVISTAAFADADGLPETSWLVVDGQRLLVVCERLNRHHWYSPVGDSYLLVLDLATRTWVDCNPSLPGVQGILLAATNPYCEPVREGGHLLLGCTGYYGLLDGGVDVVDLTALVSLGLEVTEAQLGGDLVDLAAGVGNRRHAVVSNTSTFATALKVYTPGGAVGLLNQATGFHHADIAFDGGFQLFVADRRPGQTGIRVFDAASGAQLTVAPIATGLPPAYIALPTARPVSAPLLPLASVALAAPYPNPANPRTRVAFTAPPGSVVDLRVIDLRGRLVRQVTLTSDAAGQGAWEFDGSDAVGHALPSGVYRVVASGEAGFAARSLTLVR